MPSAKRVKQAVRQARLRKVVVALSGVLRRPPAWEPTPVTGPVCVSFYNLNGPSQTRAKHEQRLPMRSRIAQWNLLQQTNFWVCGATAGESQTDYSGSKTSPAEKISAASEQARRLSLGASFATQLSTTSDLPDVPPSRRRSGPMSSKSLLS